LVVLATMVRLESAEIVAQPERLKALPLVTSNVAALLWTFKLYIDNEAEFK